MGLRYTCTGRKGTARILHTLRIEARVASASAPRRAASAVADASLSGAADPSAGGISSSAAATGVALLSHRSASASAASHASASYVVEV